MTATVAGVALEIDAQRVRDVAAGLEPEPVQVHYVVIDGRRYPPKQILAEVAGLDRADFTTHQARSILRRLGFGVHRAGAPSVSTVRGVAGPHGGREATELAGHAGRWVAQRDRQVIFDADSPEAVLQWLRRHNRRARVWRVPASPDDVGSALSSP